MAASPQVAVRFCPQIINYERYPETFSEDFVLQYTVSEDFGFRTDFSDVLLLAAVLNPSALLLTLYFG